MCLPEAGNYAFFFFWFINSIVVMIVFKLHIGSTYLYHLLHNGHSTNVNWMNDLITLTLNDDLCDLWQDVHHLHPSALAHTGAAPLSTGISSGVNPSTSGASSSPNICHYHQSSPRTSLDAIPLRWLRRSSRKTSKRNGLSLSQHFFICLSSFLLPSHIQIHIPTHPSALFHPEWLMWTSQVPF